MSRFLVNGLSCHLPHPPFTYPNPKVIMRTRHFLVCSANIVSLHMVTVYRQSTLLSCLGIAVRIFGTTSPTSGNYSVTLDGTQSPILSAKSSFINTDVLLFFASGLEANVSHLIQVRNEGGGILQLNSGAFNIFSSGEPTYVKLFNVLFLIIPLPAFFVYTFSRHLSFSLRNASFDVPI